MRRDLKRPCQVGKGRIALAKAPSGLSAQHEAMRLWRRIDPATAVGKFERRDEILRRERLRSQAFQTQMMTSRPGQLGYGPVHDENLWPSGRSPAYHG
ncbi:hypothetical protein ACQR1I_20245 [Bradyrhizobium sp. HKCCYLS2038]|uniref:hypothetical protein n=1 Tax=unclassified Bradyrhizobium TaxID=2631580 RepID=UPI003EBCC6A8